VCYTPSSEPFKVYSLVLLKQERARFFFPPFLIHQDIYYFVFFIKMLTNLYHCIQILHIAKNYKQCYQLIEIGELNKTSGNHVAWVFFIPGEMLTNFLFLYLPHKVLVIISV
jgi:hypothetical protein